MPLIPSEDGVLLFSIDDKADMQGGTPQSVVYENGVPVWDRHSWEASRNEQAPVSSTDPPVNVVPTPHGPSGVIRVTGDGDNPRPVGMGYWPVINNHAGHDILHVLVSLDDALTLFDIEKATGRVSRGEALPLLPDTGEMCYWSFSYADVLYVPRNNALLSYRLGGAVRSEFIAPALITHPHSSYDGQVHSFEMEGGAAVYRGGSIKTFPTPGIFDECQVDKSGRWLLVRYTVERLGKGHLDNLIVDLVTGQRWTILDEDGAVGHCDMGFGYMVGEDDQVNPGGVFRLWRFSDQGPKDEGPVYDWGGWAPMTRYVSHCNARNAPPEGQRVLFSGTELGLVAVTLGQRDARLVAPSLTDLNASGGGDTYWKQTRACIDPTGEWAAWSGNDGTDRMHIFAVKL